MKKVVNVLTCCLLVLTLSGCGTKEASENKESKKEYYCEDGNLNGTVCEIIATEDAIESCDKDYKLNDGKCVKTSSIKAQATKSCSDGYELKNDSCVSKNGVDRELVPACRGGIQEKFDYDPERNYYYRSVRAEDHKCIVQICQNADGTDCYEDYVEPIYELGCENGMKEIDGKCYKTSKVKTTYTCSEGKLSGSKCTITETKEITNTCKTEGFTYNTESKTCEKVTTTDALEK